MLARLPEEGEPIVGSMGMLKKAASGVLASLPCARTMSTLRASNRLRPCWTDFFDHSRRLLISISSGAFMGHVREIFNRPSMLILPNPVNVVLGARASTPEGS